MRRSRRVKPISDKRAAERRARDAVRLEVFRRDQRCLLAGYPANPRCLAPMLTPHHLRKAGQGGAYTLENLVALCAGHNDWLETREGAQIGEALGLVIRRGRTHDEAWTLMQAAGLVNYWWDGVGGR